MMDKDFLIFLGTIPWVVFLFVILINLKKYNKDGNYLFRLFLFVFLFSAVRYGIGYDYFSYKEIVSGDCFDYQLERFELIPRYLALISRYIHPQLFFIISSFLTIYPVYYVSKRLSPYPIESFCFYCLLPILFLDGLGIVRNAIAFSMILLSFWFLHEKKYLISIVFFMLALGSHVSAIVALAILPFYYLFHKKTVNVVLYILSFIASFLIIPLLLSYFSNYYAVAKVINYIDQDFSGGGLLTYIVNSIALFNLHFWNKIRAYSKDNAIYLTFVNIGVCLWNSFLPIDLVTAQRTSTYFIFFIIFLVPSYRHIFINRKIYKSIVIYFVLLFLSSIILNLRAHYVKGLNMSNIPYQIFFLNPSDIFYHTH